MFTRELFCKCHSFSQFKVLSLSKFFFSLTFAEKFLRSHLSIPYYFLHGEANISVDDRPIFQSSSLT